MRRCRMQDELRGIAVGYIQAVQEGNRTCPGHVVVSLFLPSSMELPMRQGYSADIPRSLPVIRAKTSTNQQRQFCGRYCIVPK
jgi:hypothetical protein